MKRISTNMPNDDMQYHLRIREARMNDVQNKMAEQTRIKELRDDPLAAAHSTRYQSHIARLQRYTRNIDTLQSNQRITEEYLKSANEILHRIRELAVQGANGTYSTDQKRMMGVEINELLNELVQTANGRSADGSAIFAGDAASALPFVPLRGNVPGADGQVITEVMYTGSLARNGSQISENSVMKTGYAGNELFWAEQQEIIADVEATSYVVRAESAILIDGVRIDLAVGDNVHAIAAKINDSPAAVRASLDPVRNSLILRTTYPHQLWIEDSAGGTVLQDLGIITGHGRPPYNLAPGARSAGGSVFDMVIALRDRLYGGETLEVGGSGLKGIDLAQSNVIASLAEIGAQYERLDFVGGRIAYETPELIGRNSKEVDLDLTEAIMNLKMLEYNHRAALQTAAKILQPTLLDFLR